MFSHPYISFFHLLVNGFSVTCLIIIIIITSSDGFSQSVLKRTLHHLYHIVTNFPEICALLLALALLCGLKVREKSTETSKRMPTKFVSIGSYSPEVRTFGTLIMSTKVFSLIISKTI